MFSCNELSSPVKLFLCMILSPANTEYALLFGGRMFISPSEMSVSDSLLRVKNISISTLLHMSKTLKNGLKWYIFKKSGVSTQGICTLRPMSGKDEWEQVGVSL